FIIKIEFRPKLFATCNPSAVSVINMPCSGSRPAVVSAFLRGAARTSSARPRFDTTVNIPSSAALSMNLIAAALESDDAITRLMRIAPSSDSAGKTSSYTLEARQNAFAREWMLPDSDAACVIDSVGDCGRNGTNAGFAEALHSVEPAGFQAVHVDLRHLRNIHNCG